MEKNLYGIEESNKVASIAATLIGSIKNIDTNKDSNISTLEILNALQVNAFKIISNTPDIFLLKKEAGDYSEQEKDNLAVILGSALQLATMKAKALVERAFSIILDIIDFIIDLRKEDSFFEPEEV